MSLKHTPNLPLHHILSSLISITLCFSTEAEPLPLGTVLDANGEEITIPSQQNSSLHYSSRESLKSIKPKTVFHNTSKIKQLNNSSSKTNNKHKYSSQQYVANDPSCRWLNNRIQLLQNNLKNSRHLRKDNYQKQELKIRRAEWDCMNCTGEGPSQSDYDRCQYRR